jgi:hypothetical protein
MSFEVGLRGTHRGAPTQGVDPFTKEPMTYEPLVMSSDELQAAISVMSRYGATTNHVGVTQVVLAKAKLQFTGLDAEGDMPRVDGDLASACEFLFELATAGQMAIYNVYSEEGEPACYVTTPEAYERAQTLQDEDDLGPTVLIENAGQLLLALAPHHAHAMAYAAHATSSK